MYSIAAVLEISLAPTVAAPALARAKVTAWLAHDAHDGAFIEVARLLVSELVTNCIRHARITSDQPLRLTASLRAATLRVEIRDCGTHGSVARRSPQERGSAGGFGLEFVARVANSWGVERDSDGTTVWLELPTTAGVTA